MLLTKAWVLIALLVNPAGEVTSKVEGTYKFNKLGMKECWDDKRVNRSDKIQRTCIPVTITGLR